MTAFMLGAAFGAALMVAVDWTTRRALRHYAAPASPDLGTGDGEGA